MTPIQNSIAYIQGFEFGQDIAKKEIRLAVEAEREAIAKMIEDAPALMDFARNDQGGCLMCGFTPKLAAQFIRTRGQA